MNIPPTIAPADILVVDDNPANLRLLVNVLTAQGYKVRPASNGRLALLAAQAQPPDLILLDIMMPEMNGYEVCRRLKTNPRTCDAPVIFTSVLNDLPDKAAIFAAGGADYVSKPFQFDELLARVGTHVALGYLRRRIDESGKGEDESI